MFAKLYHDIVCFRAVLPACMDGMNTREKQVVYGNSKRSVQMWKLMVTFIIINEDMLEFRPTVTSFSLMKLISLVIVSVHVIFIVSIQCSLNGITD